MTTEKKNIKNIKNIILIDNNLKFKDNFCDYTNDNTLPILYSYNTKRNDLLNELNKYFLDSTIDRLCIVFSDPASDNSKTFIENDTFFTINDIQSPKDIFFNLINSNTYIDHDVYNYDASEGYSDNLFFIINLIKKFNIKNIDFLAPNSLKYYHWKKFYSILIKETNVTVGASLDNSGKLFFNCSFIDESSLTNTKKIYFNLDLFTDNYHEYLEHTVINTNGSNIYLKQDRVPG